MIDFQDATIKSQVVALTCGADETADEALARVRSAFKYIDATKFLDANGDLDATEIQTFAQSLAPRDLQETLPVQTESVKTAEDSWYATLSPRK